MSVRVYAEMAGIGFLVLGFGHYALPRVLGRRLHRLEAYASGVLLGMWLPVALVTWLEGLEWTCFWVVVAVGVGPGAGTVLAWALDHLNWLGGVPRLTQDVWGVLKGNPDDGEQKTGNHRD